METRAHHVLIGFFTLFITVAALLFGLWLGKPGGDQQFMRYDVVFSEPVSGLSRGSTVEFNGIKVGEVSNLRLDADDPRQVIARVRVEMGAPVRTDTRARLVPTGITGLSTIRLMSGDDASSTLLRPSRDEVPVIVAELSPMSRLMVEGEDAMLHARELMLAAREIFSPENVRHFSATLSNVHALSETLAGQREDIGTMLQQLAETAAQATSTIAEVGEVMRSTNRLVDGELKQTLASAQRSMSALERVMGDVEALTSDNREHIGSGLRGLAGIGPAVTELHNTLISLNAITRQLEERPADFLLGRESTREFKP